MGVDERDGKILLDVREQWHWNDERLAFDKFDEGGCFPMDLVQYAGSPSGQIWHPDVFLVNAVETPSVRGEYWRLYADGNVSWSRTSVKWVTCPFDFRLMPYDLQTCRTRAQLYRGNQDTEVLAFRRSRGVQGPGGRNIGGAQEWI